MTSEPIEYRGRKIKDVLNNDFLKMQNIGIYLFRLTAREETILKMRSKGYSYSQIGLKFNFTGSRAQQLCVRAMKKLRQMIVSDRIKIENNSIIEQYQLRQPNKYYWPIECIIWKSRLLNCLEVLNVAYGAELATITRHEIRLTKHMGAKTANELIEAAEGLKKEMGNRKMPTREECATAFDKFIKKTKVVK
ncbi:MAG: hypothetical protein M0R06_11140 [Sphaerochaeta sp.]|nr:hypothetical protein [Sphaerochaeta sp.]